MRKIIYFLKSHLTKEGHLQSLRDYEHTMDFLYPEDAQYQEDEVSAEYREGLSWVFGIPIFFIGIFYSEDLRSWKVIFNPKNDWGIRKISDFGWFRIDSESEILRPKFNII
jgi:hypothetical protein